EGRPNRLVPSMLASFPASMLNQNTPDLGILNRLKLDPSRSSYAGSAKFPAPAGVAAVAAFRHFDANEAIMRKCCPHPQFVPGIEHLRRQRLAFRHQAPRRLAHGRG